MGSLPDRLWNLMLSSGLSVSLIGFEGAAAVSRRWWHNAREGLLRL